MSSGWKRLVCWIKGHNYNTTMLYVKAIEAIQLGQVAYFDPKGQQSYVKCTTCNKKRKHLTLSFKPLEKSDCDRPNTVGMINSKLEIQRYGELE